MFGISTVYGLDGPGYEPQWGKEIFIFTVFGPGSIPQLPVQWLSGLLGVNRLGRDIDHSPRFCAKFEDSTSVTILHWRVMG